MDKPKKRRASAPPGMTGLAWLSGFSMGSSYTAREFLSGAGVGSSSESRSTQKVLTGAENRTKRIADLLKGGSDAADAKAGETAVQSVVNSWQYASGAKAGRTFMLNFLQAADIVKDGSGYRVDNVYNVFNLTRGQSISVRAYLEALLTGGPDTDFSVTGLIQDLAADPGELLTDLGEALDPTSGDWTPLDFLDMMDVEL